MSKTGLCMDEHSCWHAMRAKLCMLREPPSTLCRFVKWALEDLVRSLRGKEVEVDWLDVWSDGCSSQFRWAGPCCAGRSAMGPEWSWHILACLCSIWIGENATPL